MKAIVAVPFKGEPSRVMDNLPEIPIIGLVEPSAAQVQILQRTTSIDNEAGELRANIAFSFDQTMALATGHDRLHALGRRAQFGKVDAIGLDVYFEGASTDLIGELFDGAEETDPAVAEQSDAVMPETSRDAVAAADWHCAAPAESFRFLPGGSPVQDAVS
ncbi:hypothetical protein [Sinorhizobium americanum]|uniref:hypothetical protein n=1 Tax=Sinorhizobium americanum TaxID=194963 RepID=UPI0014054E57|nr:hypothetical protein [Sinorhizobium americanum]